jgi:hypothetical protein
MPSLTDKYDISIAIGFEACNLVYWCSVLEFLNNPWGLRTSRNRVVVSARQAT